MNLETIKKIVENVTNIDITKESRKREIVEARCIYYKISKLYTKSSLDKIGELLNKNHATVLHGIKKFDMIYDSSIEIKENYKNCLIYINSKGLQDIKEATNIKDLKLAYLNIIILKNVRQSIALKNIESKEFKVKYNIKNPIVRDFLSRDDETINIVAETRLKPFFKMLDNRVTYEDILKNRPKSVYS